jgi:formate dehydrogenase subunit delta
MEIERLVKMANDIGNFFNAEPDRDTAVNGTADHIRKFWDPRMKRAIIAHLRKEGGVGLSELARTAVTRLESEVVSLSETGDG